MSQNNTNYGNQVLSFDFREEARASLFNRLFSDLLPYGIYSGGSLERISGTIIDVNPLTTVIRSNEEDVVALKIDTQDKQQLSFGIATGSQYCDTSKPYVILRFGWHDIEANYMEIKNVSYSSDPHEASPDKLWPLDIILGKVVFKEVSANAFQIDPDTPFDYTRRNDVFLRKSELSRNQFQVQASEGSPNKVHITGGTLDTSKGRFDITGGDFPASGIPDTTTLGRIDLVALDDEGHVVLVQGTPAVTPVSPRFRNYRVLAKIKRGSHRTDIKGSDILRINDGVSLQGTIAAEDIPLKDADNHFPANYKTAESALHYLWDNSIIFSPGNPVFNEKIIRRYIKWGTVDPDDIYALCVPIKDSKGLFSSTDVESVLAEIAGAGRTNESLKSLADAIKALAEIVGDDEEALSNHINSTVDADNVVHGLKVVVDEDYPLD